MRLKIIKKGFNYSQDGPGNRLVYHLQGCNMQCPWCANPESISSKGTLMVDKKKLLDTVCPYGAIQRGLLDRGTCGKCRDRVCLGERRNEGIRLSCFEQSLDAVIKEALDCRGILFDHGGVTFSGGEPTLQFAELKDILIKLKENHIHTAIESNGTNSRLGELFPYVDLLIMDFKHIDEGIHKQATGVSSKTVKSNISEALNGHPNVWIRTPLIHGFNDNRKYIDLFIHFYKQFHCDNVRFEFLKYHEYGKEKWEQCGLEYKMLNGHVTEEIRELYEREFQKNNLKTIRT